MEYLQLIVKPLIQTVIVYVSSIRRFSDKCYG